MKPQIRFYFLLIFILVIALKLHTGMLGYSSAQGKFDTRIAQAIITENLDYLTQLELEYAVEQELHMRLTFNLNYVILALLLFILIDWIKIKRGDNYGN